MTWEFFTHYLLSRRAGAMIRVIAWLCILGIGVGVFALVVVLSVMNGFNDSIGDKLLAVEPHLVLTPMDDEALPDKEKIIFTAGPDEIEAAFVFEQQDVIIRTVEGLFGGAVAKALEGDELYKMLKRVHERALVKKTATRTFDFNPEDLEPGEVIMGADLARSMGVFEGDQVVLVPPEALLLPPGEAPDFEKVTVKALLYTEIADIDSQMVFYKLDQTMRRFKDAASIVRGIELRLKEPREFEAPLKKLKRLGAHVESWRDRNQSLFFALKMEKIIMTVFLTLGTIITSFSIVTILVLLMTQKRPEIGVLMAMGMSRVVAQKTFTKVGMILAGLGLGGGLILGVLVSLILSEYPMEILPDIYYDASIPASLDPAMVFFVFLGTILVAFLAAWFPVRANVQMSPSQAMRGRRVLENE